MRMGIATFMPLRYGLVAEEPPEVVALIARLETAMDEGRHVSLHALLADLEALPKCIRDSRSGRCLHGWLLGELRQYARSMAVLGTLLDDLRADSRGPDADVALRWLVSTVSYQGLLYLDLGQPDRAAACFAEARAELRSIAPVAAPTRTVVIDPDEAARLKEIDQTGLAALLLDTLHMMDEAGDTGGIARVLNNLGHLYLSLGDPMGARYWFERSVELLQHSPSDVLLVYALDSLGQCYLHLGMLAEAQPLLGDALKRAVRVEAPILQACVLTCLADLERDVGREKAAVQLYERALLLAGQWRDPRGQARAQMGLSVLHRRAGRFALSAEVAAEAENLLRFEGASLLRLEASLHAHVVGLLMGKEEAAEALRQAVDHLRLRHARREEVLGTWYLALLEYRAGRREEALAHLKRALTLAARYSHLHLLAMELPCTADLVQLLVDSGICPEGLAGLVRRASPAGLSELLERSPGSAAMVAAVGRLNEALVLSVSLLGLFRVRQGGREIDLGAAHSQKAVSLFKYLVGRRGQLVTREQILETIWPEADPEGAERSFQVTLSTLRRLLDPKGGPPVIIRRSRGYMLNPECPLDVDVDRFLRHVQKGNWWWEQGEVVQAALEWLRAEECYGGDLLADDPIRESAGRVRMKAHVAMGERALALRDYRRLVAALRQELGEEPMPETQELARQIWRALRAEV